MYCLKCKKHTDTNNIRNDTVTVKGVHRPRRVGTCAVCESRQSEFTEMTTSAKKPAVVERKPAVMKRKPAAAKRKPAVKK